MPETENEGLKAIAIIWTKNEIEYLKRTLEKGYHEKSGYVLDDEDREDTKKLLAIYENNLARWQAESEQIKERRESRVYHHQG